MIVIHNLPLRSTLPVAFLNSQSLAFNNSALFGRMAIAMISSRHFNRNESRLTETILIRQYYLISMVCKDVGLDMN